MQIQQHGMFTLASLGLVQDIKGSGGLVMGHGGANLSCPRSAGKKLFIQITVAKLSLPSQPR